MKKRLVGTRLREAVEPRRFKHYMCLASDCVHAEHPFTHVFYGRFSLF